MLGQGEGAFSVKGGPVSLLPQRAAPVSEARSQGGYSLLKRECPPPGPPKEKRGGISISPRTPLETTQRPGASAPAFGNHPPRGRGTRDEGRGQGPPLETPPGVGRGAAAEREAGGVLFAARCVPCPQMRGRSSLNGTGIAQPVGDFWILSEVRDGQPPFWVI